MFNLTLLASWNNIYYEVEGSSRHSTWQSRHVVSVNYWPADNMDLLQLQQFVSRISKSSIKKRWYGVCRYAKKIKKHSARFFVNNSRNSKVPKKEKMSYFCLFNVNSANTTTNNAFIIIHSTAIIIIWEW